MEKLDAKFLFKYYILLDMPLLLKHFVLRGGILVIFMMTFEFVGAFISGHDLGVAIQWSLEIIAPTVTVAIFLTIGLGLIFYGIAKKQFRNNNNLSQDELCKAWQESRG